MCILYIHDYPEGVNYYVYNMCVNGELDLKVEMNINGDCNYYNVRPKDKGKAGSKS